ncbi:MAG: hypothetical protein U0165_16485 [Polyangiaceae bacterium]
MNLLLLERAQPMRVRSMKIRGGKIVVRQARLTKSSCCSMAKSSRWSKTIS